jgi:hypothetical protein
MALRLCVFSYGDHRFRSEIVKTPADRRPEDGGREDWDWVAGGRAAPRHGSKPDLLADAVHDVL